MSVSTLRGIYRSTSQKIAKNFVGMSRQFRMRSHFQDRGVYGWSVDPILKGAPTEICFLF